MTHLLEQQIGAMKESLVAMARQAIGAVTMAVRSLVERDGELALSVIANDASVDRFEVDIDERAILLLAKALLAADLRLVIVAMKISHDLERVADEATTIARRAISMEARPDSAQAVEIQRMADLALGMLNDAVDAFALGLPGKARAVIPRDEEVDALNSNLRRELTDAMLEQRGGVNDCVNLIIASKSLERVADHAVSAAEEVVYLCEGENIRHAKLENPRAIRGGEA
jgi:phosphate transport system protein